MQELLKLASFSIVDVKADEVAVASNSREISVSLANSFQLDFEKSRRVFDASEQSVSSDDVLDYFVVAELDHVEGANGREFVRLHWSELGFAIESSDLRGTTEDHEVRCIVEVPVLMAPVLACDSHPGTSLVDDEGNLVFGCVLAKLLVESRRGKVGSRESDGLDNDGLDGVRGSAVLDEALEFFETCFLLLSVSRLVVDHWELQHWSRSSHPVKPWHTETAYRRVETLASQGLRVTRVRETQHGPGERLVRKVLRPRNGARRLMREQSGADGLLDS